MFVLIVYPRQRPAATRSASRTLEVARQRAAREVAIRQRIKAGEALFEILNMDAAVKAAGIAVIDKTWREVK
jgi:hypothetical protein